VIVAQGPRDAGVDLKVRLCVYQMDRVMKEMSDFRLRASFGREGIVSGHGARKKRRERSKNAHVSITHCSF